MYSSNNNRIQQPNLNWCEYNQKNKPQGNAVATEIMLSFGAGIILSTILLNGDLRRDKWSTGQSDIFILLSGVSFFIGAIIGAIVASYMVKTWFKKQIKQVPIVLFYVTGILLMAFPSNAIVIFVARLVSGIGYGFIHLVYIVHMSEVSVPKLRGMFLNTFNFCLTAGLVLGSAFTMTKDIEMVLPPYRAYGIFIFLYTAMGHIFLYTFGIESPIFLLKQGDVVGATQAMMKLRNESTETWDIRDDIKDFKEMLEEESQSNSNIWKEGNIKAILLVLCVKLLIVFSFNYPLNVIRIRVVDTYLFTEELSGAPVIFSSTRMLFSLFFIFLIDNYGRRFHILFGGGFATFLAIVLSIFLYLRGISRGGLEAPTVFCCCFETFPIMVFGIDDILCGEAFPIIKKSQSIAFIIIVENILQATLLISTFSYMNETDMNADNYYYIIALVLGILILIVTFIGYKYVPETTGLPLKGTKTLLSYSQNYINYWSEQ